MICSGRVHRKELALERTSTKPRTTKRESHIRRAHTLVGGVTASRQAPSQAPSLTHSKFVIQGRVGVWPLALKLPRREALSKPLKVIGSSLRTGLLITFFNEIPRHSCAKAPTFPAPNKAHFARQAMGGVYDSVTRTQASAKLLGSEVSDSVADTFNLGLKLVPDLR